MNKNRIIAILLFSIAGLAVWLIYVSIQAAENANIWLIIGGAVSAVVATSLVTYWLAPKIYNVEPLENSPSLGASYGAVITILSYLLGSILLGIGMTIASFFMDNNYTVIDGLQGMFLVSFVGFFTALIYMSPGIILGGIVGVIYYYIIITKDQEQPPNKAH